MNHIDEIYDERSDASGFADGYLSYLSDVLSRLDRGQVARFISVLDDASQREATVFFLGNGGSAATASHFQNDLTGWRQAPMRVVALTDNVAVLTAVGNDHGYEHVFRMQLENLMRPDDVVVAISASGNSPNVLQAIEYANEHGATTVGLTGFDGGKLARIVAVNVHAPTEKGEYGPAEDVHMILDHLVMSYLRQHWAASRGAAANGPVSD